MKILRGWSQRRRFFHHALTGSLDHNSGVQFLRLRTFTLHVAGKKCRGSTGFLLGTLAGTTLPATTETFGVNIKTGCQDASEFRKNTLGYHAFQTAGQWVRGELRNMQVAGQMNNDENRPKLSPQIDIEVVDQVAGLGCCAALLLWVTMTMTRSGEATEQMQETRKRHTPDLARVLD